MSKKSKISTDKPNKSAAPALGLKTVKRKVPIRETRPSRIDSQIYVHGLVWIPHNLIYAP